MNGADGATPGSGTTLAFDHARDIYGTTTLGGSNNLGTVYELTPSGDGWTEGVLYSFTGGSDEGHPYSGVTFDNTGNLYGTTAIGPHSGTVYELSPSGSGWTENTLYTFQNGDDGASPLAGVIFDQSGSMYGATQHGGAGNGGTAFELMPSGGNWVFSLLCGFSGQTTGGVYRNLVMDNAGNLYGTTAGDGSNGWGSVFKLTPSGGQPCFGQWTYSSLHDFTGGDDGGNPQSSLIFDTNGNLYGTARLGGANNKGVVFQIRP
jgi:uncharacterized repeat protein (TIGR03803 family)